MLSKAVRALLVLILPTISLTTVKVLRKRKRIRRIKVIDKLCRLLNNEKR